MSRFGGRRGFAFVDVLMVLGALAVVASIASPLLKRRAYRQHVERVVSSVEALRSASTQYRDSTGDWPEDAGAGRVPGELVPLLPATLGLHEADYSVGWMRWNVVEIPRQPAPPPPDSTGRASEPDSLGTRPPVIRTIGGITVHSADAGLLGALLKRFGTATSFVRDSSWTLVLGRGGA